MVRIPAIDDRDSTYPPSAQTQQDQGQLGESDFSDGSGLLFSMYLERAEEEDVKRAESWKGDADGMLVFVGRRLHLQCRYDIENVDWFVLCCRCGIARSDRPGYSAKLARHFCLLSRKHTSATCPVEWYPNSHPIHLAQSCCAIHAAYFSRLGQRALVYELG